MSRGDIFLYCIIVVEDMKLSSLSVIRLFSVFCFCSVLPSLIDRLGDAKDQVRDQDQALLLKIMDQAANPQVHNSTHIYTQQTHTHTYNTHIISAFLCEFLAFQYVWERMMGGFKHKNNRTREGLCLCLISTLNV